MTQQYDESSIIVAKGLEGLRMKPAMYIGNLDNGRFAILKEILDNAVDESTSGYSRCVKCIIDKDGYCTVCDQGRGIPVGVHPDYQKEGKSTLEIVLTQLHAGGKLKSGAYHSGSIGTHGVGSSATNALSKHLQVWTYRDKSWWTQTFEKGIPTSDVHKVDVAQLPVTDQAKGTIVKFIADDSILKHKLNERNVIDYMSDCSHLNPGIQFELTLSNGKSKSFKSKGLEDYITQLTNEQFDSLGKPFVYHSDKVDVALQWFESENSTLTTWCNSSKTIEGGTHLDGLMKVISKGFDSFAKKKNYKLEDLKVGLYGGLNIKIAEPQFDSQTKEKLINTDCAKIVADEISSAFETYLNKNKSFVKRVIDRANEMRAIYTKFANEKKALSKIKIKGKAALPPPSKFVVSNTKNAEERELFIVEGLSAGGTARMARNPYFQEVLKLKGKILNTAKQTDAKVYESEDVINIFKALGFDPTNKERKLRIGKVIILTDADVDGSHISVLLLTLFKFHYPELLEQGRVYTVDAPLFIGKTKTRTVYGADLLSLQKQLRENEKIQSVTRIKGWGEASADLLKTLAFDKSTRKLFQVRDVKGSQLEYFKKIVGEDTDVRKKLLMEI